MSTDLLEDIEQKVYNETVRTHRWCKRCYPELIPFETKAMCGSLLAGILYPKGTDINCDACEECWEEHIIKHIWDGDE